MTERLHPAITMTPDASGGFTRYQFHGCGPWTPGTTVPLPYAWLVAQITEGAIPEIMRHDATRFRSPTGAGKGIPWRYAAIQVVEPVTETSPGPVQPMDSRVLLQDLVNALMKQWKLVDIRDAMDRSPYNLDNEGEPEP